MYSAPRTSAITSDGIFIVAASNPRVHTTSGTPFGMLALFFSQNPRRNGAGIANSTTSAPSIAAAGSWCHHTGERVAPDSGAGSGNLHPGRKALFSLSSLHAFACASAPAGGLSNTATSDTFFAITSDSAVPNAPPPRMHIFFTGVSAGASSLPPSFSDVGRASMYARAAVVVACSCSYLGFAGLGRISGSCTQRICASWVALSALFWVAAAAAFSVAGLTGLATSTIWA
mmetsp:Transcript_62483/g.147343  ORF Transcript_62483/g.147343 Transcript_62483/m.147343 type:complete len:230 (-) Transcript_62483:155-844(-)